MAVLSRFPATPLQFVKDNNTDVVNLFLGWAVFWAYGFRTVFQCGYTSIQEPSEFYCNQFINEIEETCDGQVADCWESIPYFAQQYNIVSIGSLWFMFLTSFGLVCSRLILSLSPPSVLVSSGFPLLFVFTHAQLSLI